MSENADKREFVWISFDDERTPIDSRKREKMRNDDRFDEEEDNQSKAKKLVFNCNSGCRQEIKKTRQIQKLIKLEARARLQQLKRADRDDDGMEWWRWRENAYHIRSVLIKNN
jgi:hypothetical protein